MTDLKTLPIQIAADLGLYLCDKTCNDSCMLGLVFYETPYKGLFLTNYDVAGTQFNPDLSGQNIWCLFYEGNRRSFVYLTQALLSDTVVMKALMEHLYKNMTRQTMLGLPINLN